MGAVAYTSTAARRRVYQKEEEREIEEKKDHPEGEKQEIRQMFKSWGYDGQELEELTQQIAENPKAMEEFMMAFELKLAPVGKSEARQSAFIVGGSTVFGSVIPLLPYFFVGKNILNGTVASVFLSGIVLFLIGVYEAKTTIGSLWKSGMQMAVIGLTSGLAGFLIGHFIGALPL